MTVLRYTLTILKLPVKLQSGSCATRICGQKTELQYYMYSFIWHCQNGSKTSTISGRLRTIHYFYLICLWRSRCRTCRHISNQAQMCRKPPIEDFELKKIINRKLTLALKVQSHFFNSEFLPFLLPFFKISFLEKSKTKTLFYIW